MEAAVKIEHRLTELEIRVGNIEKQQADYGKLVEAIASVSEREKIVENVVKEIQSDVKNITSKPEKRWELVITVAITAVVTALITYCISNIGL